MDPKQITKLIAEVVGPVLGDEIAAIRNEIKELADLDREDVACRIAEAVDCFAQKRFNELEARIKVLEKRFQAPRRVA